MDLVDGPAVMAFHTDLTETRQAIEARARAEEQLHHAQKMEALRPQTRARVMGDNARKLYRL